MATKKEENILELLEKHASTSQVAKQIYNKLVKAQLDSKKALLDASVNELVCGCGFGRASLLVVMCVICDMTGKK